MPDFPNRDDGAARDGASALRQVLADARGEAAVLRRRGQGAMADALEDLAAAVQRAAEPFLVELSETDARLFSGMSRDWLRRQFPALAERGLARLHAGERYYLECALPKRTDRVAAREAGRQAAREAMRRGRTGTARGDDAAA